MTGGANGWEDFGLGSKWLGEFWGGGKRPGGKWREANNCQPSPGTEVRAYVAPFSHILRYLKSPPEGAAIRQNIFFKLPAPSI